jgi:hypothetical protein
LLGFCNSEDFSEIKQRLKLVNELKQLHGKDWRKFDTEI